MSAPVASSSNQPAPGTQPQAPDISETVLDALPGQIALLDRSGTISFANRAWQDFAVAGAYAGAGFGVGSDYPRLCLAAGGADGLAIAHGVQALLARSSPAFAHEYACLVAGDERWFRLTASPRGDDSVQGVVVMQLDITSSIARNTTEQKRIEAALRESEERFRQLAENISMVFWLTSRADDSILYVSPAYERVWGRPCNSLYADPYAYFETVHPDDRERAWEVFARNNDSSYDIEYRIVRP
ncbi:MAG TPA: PAS domain-containing protein, partial [Roseiflexaceae bacterium]|nr:PAS domain-containing protein [Roseiflexaceae bacterium]